MISTALFVLNVFVGQFNVIVNFDLVLLINNGVFLVIYSYLKKKKIILGGTGYG